MCSAVLRFEQAGIAEQVLCNPGAVLWKTISGHSCSKYSAGMVLRLDPDLSRSIAAKAAENKAKIEELSTRIGADAFITEARRDLQAPSRTSENGKWGYRDNSSKMSISAQCDRLNRP